MQIDPGYPDVREDYAELLFEVGAVGKFSGAQSDVREGHPRRQERQQ